MTKPTPQGEKKHKHKFNLVMTKWDYPDLYDNQIKSRVEYAYFVCPICLEIKRKLVGHYE